MIGAYHKCVTAVVARFDGFVARYTWETAFLPISATRAHEDDAERAIRAGLALVDAVGRLDLGFAKLQVRVGIATGLVFVGDFIGEG